MKRLVEFAMLLSWAYYVYGLVNLWAGQLFGANNDLWDAFDLPPSDLPPPRWIIALGILVSIFLVASLTVAYAAVWRIIESGQQQDFRLLGRRMRFLGFGLVGFWIGWNLFSGAVQAVLVAQLPKNDAIEVGWDPFDIDIVFPIVAMAIIVISKTMERAWLAEDETRHFL